MSRAAEHNVNANAMDFIPTCLEDLTQEWFSKILNLTSEESNKISFNITPNADNGVGFCSSLFRIEILNKPKPTTQVCLMLITLR